MRWPSFSNAAPGSPAHRAALFATVGVLVIGGGALVAATVATGATKTVSGRAIVQKTNSSTNEVTADITTTSPEEPALVGATGTLKLTSSVKIYQHTGQTPIGGAQKDPTKARVTFGKLSAGTEIVFSGRYASGTTVSVNRVTIPDRSFAVCGTFKAITRRTAAGANLDTLTVEPKQNTVQESRYARLFPKEKDVVFTFHGSTKFWNASGSWSNPKNRRAIQIEDVSVHNQGIGLRGKVQSGNVLEIDTVDLDVKCS